MSVLLRVVVVDWFWAQSCADVVDVANEISQTAQRDHRGLSVYVFVLSCGCCSVSTVMLEDFYSVHCFDGNGAVFVCLI